jgi:glycerol kinase
MTHILAIDQGTTSSRAILFDAAVCGLSPPRRKNFPSIIPPRAGSSMTRPTCGRPSPPPPARPSKGRDQRRAIAAIGITNQRETTLLWDRATGSRSTTPSSGRTAAPPTSVPR